MQFGNDNLKKIFIYYWHFRRGFIKVKNMLKLGKQKGIVYSLITFILILPILVFLTTYLETASSRDELASIKIRGIELSNFANSISQDVPRIFKITATRALISAVNEIDVNGTPMDDAQLRIRELMLNATIYGQNSTFMQGSSLNDWADRMVLQGRRYGLNTNITFIYLNVTPYDSFSLSFNILLAVNSSDSDHTVEIVKTYNQTYLLPLEGFEDLLYPLSTSGFVKRQIKRPTYSFTNLTNIDQAVLDESYTSSMVGASFLDRMENKTTIQAKYLGQSANIIGLESIINLQKISLVGIPLRQNQSSVDYIYFNATTVNGCAVTNSSYYWLRLNDSDATRYGVSIEC